MNTCAKKIKLFVVLSLIIVVAGMALLGFLGLNNTVDYSNSYEVQVSVDHNKDGEGEIMREATEKFFADNDIKNVCYSVQEMNDGAILIYKFTEDVTDKIAGLEASIQDALTSSAFAKANVSVNQVKGVDNQNLVNVAIALVVALVAIFIYLAIMEKIAGAIATFISGLISVLIALSLIALTRIPANPFMFITMAMALVVSVGISATLVTKFRKEAKNQTDSKPNLKEIANVVLNSEMKRLLFVLAIFVLSALALCVLGFIGMPYMFFVAGHLLIAGVSATVTAGLSTALIWANLAKK